MKKILILVCLILSGCQKKIKVEKTTDGVVLDKVGTLVDTDIKMIFACEESAVCIAKSNEENVLSFIKVNVDQYEMEEIDETTFMNYANSNSAKLGKYWNPYIDYQDDITIYHLSETERIIDTYNYEEESGIYENIIEYENDDKREIIHEYRTDDPYKVSYLPYEYRISMTMDRKCYISYLEEKTLNVDEFKPNGELVEYKRFPLTIDDYSLEEYNGNEDMGIYERVYSSQEKKKVIYNDIEFEKGLRENHVVLNDDYILLREYDNDKFLNTSIYEIETKKIKPCSEILNGMIELTPSENQWIFYTMKDVGVTSIAHYIYIGSIDDNTLYLHEIPLHDIQIMYVDDDLYFICEQKNGNFNLYNCYIEKE